MHLVVENKNIIADLATLQAIPNATLANNQMMLIGDQGYIYLKNNRKGDFQPNDSIDEKGWWIHKNDKVLRKIVKLVDTVLGDQTERISLSDWDKLAIGKIETKKTPDNFVIRDKIRQIYEAIPTPTDADKIIASKWFVVNKVVRDTVKTAAQQQIDAKRLAEWNTLKIQQNALSTMTSEILNDTIVWEP